MRAYVRTCHLSEARRLPEPDFTVRSRRVPSSGWRKHFLKTWNGERGSGHEALSGPNALSGVAGTSRPSPLRGRISFLLDFDPSLPSRRSFSLLIIRERRRSLSVKV